MEDATPRSTPLATSTKLLKAGNALNTTQHNYLGLVGSLLYIAGGTRPDVTQAVGALCRYGAAPTTAHWEAARHVLRYLKGTADFCMCFGPESTDLVGWCDADYAGCPDTRRSTTGYLFTLNGGAISWCSRAQPTIAASTTEAEYMAQSEATREALWLLKACADLGKSPAPIQIFTDSQSALKLLKNPVISQRSKHIDVRHHFTRERIAKGDVTFEYVPTGEMPADALTKSVPEQKLHAHRDRMGVRGTAAHAEASAAAPA